MAESYLPLSEESGRRSAGIVQHLVTVFVGFGLGCAMIYAAGGQPLAVIMPADDMAAQLTQSAQVPQALANQLPGASPWKELAMAGIQDANRCGRDISMNAVGVKSVLARMDSKSKALLVRAEQGVKSPNEILKGVGATGPLGFWDPVGFSTDVSEGRLLFYREVELKHGRVCMLAALGIIVAEKFHPLFPGAGDLPAYIQFQNTPLQEFWIAVSVVIALPEIQGSIPTFQGGGGNGFEMKLDRVPGDLAWDPLGLKPQSEKELQELQNKEINNGRLAMIATAGMIGQELATGKKLF